MNFRKLLYISAVILAAAACKKEEEQTLTPNLDGYLTISGLPEFISPGQTATMIPKGAIHPEGKDLKYSWTVSPSRPKATETFEFTHTFSDTLRTYAVSCTASATGYTALSSTAKTTAVAPGYNGSIQGIPFKSIARDSIAVRHMQYYYRQIGEQTWTLNNMALRLGQPFRGAEVMSEVFGRYYNFEEAKSVCDSLDSNDQNWEVPSLADWKTLESHISGLVSKTYGESFTAAFTAPATFNQTPMSEFWKNVGDVTNGSGFSAIPVGYANLDAMTFEGEFEYAAFWTSDSAEGDKGQYVYIFHKQPDLFTESADKKSFGASVRCILKNN